MYIFIYVYGDVHVYRTVDLDIDTNLGLHKDTNIHQI